MDIKSNEIVLDYIESICSQIKNKEVQEEVWNEFLNHIEESVENYISNGLSKEEAVNVTIKDMGDSFEIGRRLNKIYSKSPDWSILFLAVALSAIGLTTIYFIDMNIKMFTAPRGIFQKSLTSMVVGLILAALIYFIDYRKIKKYSWHIFIGTFILSVFTCFFGSWIGGAKYLTFGRIDINVVSIYPIMFSISICGIFQEYEFNSIKAYIVAAMMFLAPSLVIFLHHSYFTTFLYIVMFMIISISTKKKPGFFISLSVIVGLLGLVDIINTPYKLTRMTVFFKPSIDKLGAGYVRILMDSILHNAKPFGYGFSGVKMHLPSAHTEFILTLIIYSFGWVTAVILVGIVGAFIARIIWMKNKVRDNYGKLIIICISSFFSIQFMLNILMILGVAPATGVNFPFISYGGTQFVINMCLIGLLSSVYKMRSLKGAPVKI